jgi:cytochrome c oxidase subunit II
MTIACNWNHLNSQMKIYNDIGENKQMMFQEPVTPYMIGIDDLHDKINYYLIIIITVVIYFIINLLITKRGPVSLKYKNHSYKLELIWTILPGLILIIIAIPSFKLLYALDSIEDIPELIVKVIGAQWYWSYEIMDKTIDSYTKTNDLLTLGDFRLLDVDNPLYLPILTPIRLLITSQDVIHSFAVPSFGVKIDAIPGRINSMNLYILKEGYYYGQCSELCGISHYSMSILIEATNYNSFLNHIINL